MNRIDFKLIARETRKRPVYVCFEEPSDPLVWAAQSLVDGRWVYSGNTGIRARQLCKRGHPGLGCGWYKFARSGRPKEAPK